jgi:serine/tyrosine/threonine adenylyltransferase
MLTFNNRFLQSLPGEENLRNHSRQVQGALWSRVDPAPVAAPQLIAHSSEVAAMLGLGVRELNSPVTVAALSGNGKLPGMETYATAYGGHQFGNWAGQLGDGRAILLGEVIAPDKHRYELQLKGAGPTPYSRRADGRAVLRSSIREFLCSEAMHHLGVPTTRALSLVLTGDQVERDMFYDGNAEMEPGAIVCRVAPTFIRFGHFELPASRGDTALLKQLVDFTISNYFLHLVALPENERIPAWYGEVCRSTAKLVAQWMRVGFVHGVMNTDNMSILGLTIDYGPYGWVDNFDPGWTPNTTDASGKRYAFGRQPGIAQWNLARLGDALATLDIGQEALQAAFSKFETTYVAEISRVFADKFGLQPQGDASEVMDAAFALLVQSEIDMTIFFRSLATVNATTQFDDLAETFYLVGEREAAREAWAHWLTSYTALVREQNPTPAQQVARSERMNRTNPKYVLRNYLAQQVIDAAHAGDYAPISELLDVMRKPYDEQPGRERFAEKRPDWARTKAGCSMLSCSS